jgi:tripartite-type tricarboxylate transporter receptor subunit TctC
MPAEFGRRPLLGALGTVWGATAATAQAGWRPERPIRMITPSGAGSGADVVARTLAAKLSELLGQPVVVENQSQGVGAVGILNAARAKPDGYTMMCVISSILLAPLVDPSLAYDVRQFAPLSQIHQGATVLAVAPGVPAKTLEEFLALARAKPDDYSIADYGHGTASHIHAALLIKRAELPVENIHYSNTPQIFQDMIAGRMRAAVVDSASGSQPIRDGLIRPLVASGRERIAVLPDVPTFGELGYRGFEPAIWQAMFLPKDVPAPIAATLEAAVRQAILAPDFVARLRNIGFVAVGGPAEALGRMLASEREIWASVIAETGIKPL